ncbi:MAG: efflux RND transporter periplasmic adaptor subunit [Geobacteraceae bacterium]|nr:efflux RND transporter periplasmic adaptor subunit [Geobacteraceae bacterium]
MKGLSSFFVVLLAALVASSLAGCSDKSKEGQETHALVTGLTVEKTGFDSIPEQFEASGTVKAKNAAQLAARISGTVSEMYVREGDRVQRGSLLVTLTALESTAGATGAAHAVEEAMARKKLADVTYERFARLYQEQAVTGQELDTRRAERDMAEQSLARAREAARAAVAVAGYTRITAPMSGVVTARTVDPGSTVFPGMPIMTIEEDGRYRLELAVPESLQGKVALGTSVPVFLDGNSGSSTGTVVEIVPKVDPVSRTFIVKLDIPAKGMHSGQFGRALLPVGEKQGLLVPKTAVLERGQLTVVWVVDDGNIVHMRLVKPGTAFADRIEILAGLSAGERIVVGGTEKVTDGARVEEGTRIKD